MAQTLIPFDRQARILRLIEKKGIVRVAELSQLFGVTELTIRRDFDYLEKKGVLERTHGGAILRRRVKVEPLYVEKNQKHRTQKEKIGMAVSKIIEPGDTLL
ncbi:MAG: DeoR/GlpR transcriptional regulator, partial [Deltaproteobacteria bacterium]|nr:DeoR/GlpR transcriptional regulator [Deltaproteobacteria bacterium]